MLHPSKTKDLALFLKSNIVLKPNLDDRRLIQSLCKTFLGISGIGDLKTNGFSDDEKKLLNKYSIYLANNQINEACNKFWAIVELLNITSPKVWRNTPKEINNLEYTLQMANAADLPEILPWDLSEISSLNYYQNPLGEDFSNTYMGGTIIPVLYYSQITALLSILSSYGCVLIRDEREKSLVGNKKRELILLRKENDWNLVGRRHFISNLPIGKKLSGWHIEIIQLFGGLKKCDIEFPNVNINLIDKLREMRAVADYGILGEVTMGGVADITDIVKLIPIAIKNIEIGVNHLKNVWQITNKCDTRFDKLKNKIPDLLESYNVKM